VDSASDYDEPPTVPERRSPRKVRKTARAASEAPSEVNSLIVKLKISPKALSARSARNRSAEPSNMSKAVVSATRRRRPDTPDIHGSIQDEAEDADGENVAGHIVASTPSTPATPDQYAGFEASIATPDKKPKWEEPDIVGFHYDYKLGVDRTPDSQKKLEYVMGVDSKIRDELTEEQRNALSEAQNEDTDNQSLNIRTTRRGGYRGRGKGGRGRGGRLASARDPLEESEVILVGGKGRGGFRVKKSENPRIQSLYHRRAALRHQFKIIANLQRAALEAYADKILVELKADPEAHTHVPEFKKVTGGLGEVFDDLLEKTEARHKIYREYLARRKERDEEYIHIAKQVSLSLAMPGAFTDCCKVCGRKCV